MANSDNVLRGGLTTKHVDVPELLRILSFEGETPKILDGSAVSAHERAYRTPAQEFELSRISLVAGDRYSGEALHGPRALLVLHGSGTLSTTHRSIGLQRGSIAFVPCGTRFVIQTGAESWCSSRPVFPAMPGAA